MVVKKKLVKKKKVASSSKAPEMVRSGLSGVKAPRTNQRIDVPKIEDLVPCVPIKLKQGVYHNIRIMPVDESNPVVFPATLWVKKEIVKDGVAREITYPRMPVGWDARTGAYKRVKDKKTGEWMPGEQDPYHAVARLDAPVVFQVIYRDVQRRSNNPRRACVLPSGIFERIQKMMALNTHKSPKGLKTYDLDHPKYGMDISIKFDSKLKGAAMYDIQKGDKCPLTAEELKLPPLDFSKIVKAWVSPETMEQAKAAFENDFGDKEDEPKKGKAKKEDAYYDDDDDDDSEDIDTRKLKAKKKVGKSEPVVKKKKVKPKVKVKTKVKRSSSDDEDDDEIPF